MTKRKTADHVVIKDNFLVCLHCGKEESLEFPLPVPAFVKQLRTFGKIHSPCEKELPSPMKVYVMMVIGYEGAAPQPVFSFEARSTEDAKNKANGWARYHGFAGRDVATREAAGVELSWDKNNEFV